ncbi:transporter [Bradyrhizobium sp.]|uniref:SphA family protein n=1 Tax=Bradyrhizobium sp. TaxID=376 RepID=UPI002633D4AE|nr:transporter [Bradyrhizobium sp.]
MKFDSKALLAAAGLTALAFTPAYATEGGDQATKPGAFIGASAGVPPPGIYMFNQVFTYDANLVGPGTARLNPPGTKTGVQAAVDVQGFLFVPGWTFLGATYDAVIVQPFVQQSLGSPINVQAAGMFNTYIVPVELSWKLGTSGFAIKTGLGIYLDDGATTSPATLNGPANPYYTFQPELIVSYLANGWNLTAAMYDEINTENRVTHYTTGNIFHADFTATKTIGKWTFGPVAYYVGQVTDDSCPVSCTALGGSILNHVQRYDEWAVGGLIGYDFGPASVSVWATQEVYAHGRNDAALAAAGNDPSLMAQGMTVFATLSYRLWAPEEPAKAPMFHK